MNRGELKDAGNSLFRSGQIEEAATKYEWAAGLFHYVRRETPSGPGGLIEDIDVTLVTDDAETPSCPPIEESTRRQARSLRAVCYTNLAQCYLRLQPPCGSRARLACDEALALEPGNAKALYRRALCRELQGGIAELKIALQDLASASSYTPADPAIRSASQRIHAELQRQASDERGLFRGLFGRGSVGRGDGHQGAEFGRRKPEAGATIEGTVRAAEHLRDAFATVGSEKEACEMQSVVDKCRARLTERASRVVDVFEPNEALVQEASRFGIDLLDPAQQRELDRVFWEVHQAETHAAHGPSRSCGAQRMSRRLALDWLVAIIFGGAAAWFAALFWPSSETMVGSA